MRLASMKMAIAKREIQAESDNARSNKMSILQKWEDEIKLQAEIRSSKSARARYSFYFFVFTLIMINLSFTELDRVYLVFWLLGAIFFSGCRVEIDNKIKELTEGEIK